MTVYIFGEDEFDRDFALDFATMPHSRRLEHALASGERILRGYRNELEVNTANPLGGKTGRPTPDPQTTVSNSNTLSLPASVFFAVWK